MARWRRKTSLSRALKSYYLECGSRRRLVLGELIVGGFRARMNLYQERHAGKVSVLRA